MRCRVTKPHLQSLGAVRVDWLLQDREACLNGAKILDAHVHCMACRQLLPRTAPRSPKDPGALQSSARSRVPSHMQQVVKGPSWHVPHSRSFATSRRYDAHTVGMLKEFSARMFALSTQPRGSVTRHKLGSSKHAPKKRTLRVKRANCQQQRAAEEDFSEPDQALVAEVAKGVDLSGQILQSQLTFLGL